MHIFNVEHSGISEYIDAKFGVHRGVLKVREETGKWFGEGHNYAGKFFNNYLLAGTVRITEPVFESLTPKMRTRFHNVGDYLGIKVYECGRCFLDPTAIRIVRFIRAATQ